MFFPEYIQHIEESDRVLEVGPGGTPHPRSDVMLEKIFSEDEAHEQRGQTDALVTEKPVIYYEGDSFPFEDDEFDYVICSHVLEHIDDVDAFSRELNRVAKKGYVEYPTIYYDFIYNFPHHKTFLFYSDGVSYWMPKSDTPLEFFRPVQDFFRASLAIDTYVDFISKFMKYFFQGFEWFGTIRTERASRLSEVCFDVDDFADGLFPPP